MVEHDVGAIIITSEMPVGMITEKDMVDRIVKAIKDGSRIEVMQ